MSKSVEEIIKELDQKIPRDVISERDGGGGRKLSYLEGWYVIDRLNKVFGSLNWSKVILDVRQITNKTSKGEFPAYLVKVRLDVRVVTNKENGPYEFVTKEAYGYGSDKSSQNAHELAIKEAVTDGLKVAAKDLGMSLGLALYDKSQENVEEYGENETKSEGRDSQVRDDKKEEHKRDEAPRENTKAEGEVSIVKLLELIQRQIKIARVQKKSEQTKEFFTKMGISNPDQLVKLNLEQLNQARTFLEELTK